MFAPQRLLVVGVVVLLLGVGGYAYADARGTQTSYRTAVATTGTVERTLTVTGTVASSGRRDLSFGTSGTVEEMLVEQGQRVKKGQVLARLDRTRLRAAVISAEASLAQAKARLVSDQTSSSTSASPAASGSGSSGGSGRPSRTDASGAGAPGGGAGVPGNGTKDPAGGSSGDASGGSDGAPSPGSGDQAPDGTGGGPAAEPPTLDIAAITTAATKLTTGIQTLTAVLNNYVGFVQGTCTTSEATQPGGACDPAATPGCPDPTVEPTSLGEAKACLSGAQAVVSEDASALSRTATTTVTAYLAAVKKYADTLRAAATADGKARGKAQGRAQGKAQAQKLIARAQQRAEQILAQARQQAEAAANAAGASADGTDPGGSTARGTSRAELIAEDESQVAAAKASLASARMAARAATLRSPIAGRVVDVADAGDDTVSTGDTVVTVLGSGRTTVGADVSLSQIPDVETGQRVSVVPAGWEKKLRGVVTRVGLLAATSSSGSTTYPVTVTIERAPSIPLGTTASMAIVTGTAEDAVTVPTSAVTPGSGTASVTVLEDGHATTKAVTVGLVGATETTITSGLEAGQTVVLADLDAALPSGDSSTTRGGLGVPSGGFGGAGPLGGVRVRRGPG